MQKGLAPIYLLIGTLVLMVVFFSVPFPAAEYPQCVQGVDCPKVWYWGVKLIVNG